MSLDMTLLRLLKHKDKFEKFRRGVPPGSIQETTSIILDDYGKFFKDNPTAEIAIPEDFIPYFVLLHPTVKEERMSIFKAMLAKAGTDVPPEVEAGLLARLQESKMAIDMYSILERWDAGDEINLRAYIREVADTLPNDTSDIPFAIDNIDELLKMDADDTGFHWRLDCLNSSMRPFRSGDMGILAARVDRGKTTMLASELSYMAPQVDIYKRGENRCILYLNNEGPSSRVIQRIYQAALGVNTTGLIKLSQEGTLRKKYLDVMGGRDIIRVVDAHDRPLSFLEDVVARTEPAIVVMDMLDVVPFDGMVNNGGTRTDEKLEAAYQRSRLWGVKYDTGVINTSQLSADADGEIYPLLSHLAGSRTGKPGAADFIIMLGASNDPGLETCRWISLPKNKLVRPGGLKDPRQQVLFEGDIARVSNPLIL